jgi:small GTP-binding protein
MSIEDEFQKIRDKLDKEANTTVSVALFGQPGAGKSSLINKIVGKYVAEVGVETDKTVEAGIYEANGLRFSDLPGYGTTKFPKESYFQQFEIQKFDLFLCVTSGKLHQSDVEFFKELLKREKVCIFVINKHDDLWEEGIETEELEQRKRDDIFKHVGQQVKIIFTSCRKNTGLVDLINEINNNLDGAKRERWARGAKAYSKSFLQEKKAACEKYVSYAAAASAANAINPIPGVNVAVDVSIIVKTFKEIRDDYGLGDNFLISLKKSSIPSVLLFANNVAKHVAKEGLLIFLESFAKKQVVKSFLNYIPFVGSVVAAGLGYAITSNAGKSYLDDCHKLAEEVLKNNLGA